jgi:hypothetical protein
MTELIKVPLTFRPPVKSITDTKEVKLNCSACETPLAIILITHDTDVVWNVRVNCPYCNDESFVTPIKGNIRYMPSDKTKLLDIDMDKKTSDGEDLLYIKVTKKE